MVVAATATATTATTATAAPPPPPPPPPPLPLLPLLPLCGGGGLAVIVSVAEVTPSDRSGAVPLTVTVSSGSSMSSSIGVRVKGAVPLCLFAAIVRGKSCTAAKSVSDSAVPDVTETVTSVGSGSTARFNVAVTLTVLPASSLTSVGLTLNLAPVDGISSSVTVTATSAADTLLAS